MDVRGLTLCAATSRVVSLIRGGVRGADMAGRPSSMCRVLRSTPLHPGIVFGGTGQRWDLETNTPLPGHDRASDARVDRAEWTQPLVISLADPRALFYASQFLYRSTDTAASWRSLVLRCTTFAVDSSPTTEPISLAPHGCTRPQDRRYGGATRAKCRSWIPGRFDPFDIVTYAVAKGATRRTGLWRGTCRRRWASLGLIAKDRERGAHKMGSVPDAPNTPVRHPSHPNARKRWSWNRATVVGVHVPRACPWPRDESLNPGCHRQRAVNGQPLW